MLANAMQMAILEGAGATGGPLVASTVHLIKDNFITGPRDTAAILAAHEADFDGYGAITKTLTWLQSYVKPDGTVALPAEAVQFSPSGSTTPNTIYGYWIQAGAGPTFNLVRSVNFPQPVSLGSIFDSLVLTPEVPFPQE